MKMDWQTRTVTQMESDEVTLFVLYRSQANQPNGLTRDNLPYTPQMDDLRGRYNQQTKSQLTPHDFWEKLKLVLKCGEDRIEQYLQGVGVQFPPKQ